MSYTKLSSSPPNETTKNLPKTSGNKKPTVIGIYGLPGSGKSYQLNRLKQELGGGLYQFYEGSEKIASFLHGGLDSFRRLERPAQDVLRRRAVVEIAEESARSNQVAIVTGHFMFWPEEEPVGRPVYTSEDLQTFTHIIYLDVPAETVLLQRLGDASRDRDNGSVEHLKKWQKTEISDMRKLCRRHHVLFTTVTGAADPYMRVFKLVEHFRRSALESNWSRIEARLGDILAEREIETAFVMDGDKTMAPHDTGTLFWKAYADLVSQAASPCPLKDLFSGPLGYSETAFQQAKLLYEEAAEGSDFEQLCETVASSVQLYDEFVDLLQILACKSHTCVILVTCGLGRVWERIFEKQGLSETVKVIGGGRLADGFVVTASVKASVVNYLRQTSHPYITAIGDSPLDLPMLEAADEAIIVVGDEKTRSQSMDDALLDAIINRGLRARQVSLPNDVPPRLDLIRLPQALLTTDTFVAPRRCTSQSTVNVLHIAENNVAKLLMAPTRDASVSGPSLREAHRSVGRYLATQFLGDLLGLEEYEIAHVQGHKTMAHRICNEHLTTIVALMRGGEPLAFGVNDRLPSAMFVHASVPSDIKPHHLEDQRTVILVDSVINSGKTLLQFIEHIRLMSPGIRIITVASVVQAGAVAEESELFRVIKSNRVRLLTLRVSTNKFTGTKNTDTGNRLFNTTHLA